MPLPKSFSRKIMYRYTIFQAQEFHQKLLTYFPAKEATGRSEFKNLHDLADYLESEDRKADLLKKREQKSS